MGDHSGCSPSRSTLSSTTSLLKLLLVQAVHVSAGDTGKVLLSVLLTQPLKKKKNTLVLSAVLKSI